ncbi:TldD/PmbA family protein [Pseudoroseicyclus tamaricis]|uniref:TldD/PmbA family protein n=1 Tax=Pseudoroseicyclus tamaricis TaxID=2705421 RepID=A0A6B2JU92_9RHOB|nr:metallopeptidase TldD-related protein [Pseudoroseicyclus tamaricis]NDV02107.1 TldD/PmbA family protein [Pseudoroseicyclus tamaricis]
MSGAVPSPAEIAEALLAAARSAGAEAADAVVIEERSSGIDVRAGKLEEAGRSESMQLGLRVFMGQRSAIASASDSRPDGFSGLAERAVAMASEAPEDPYAGLAGPDELSAARDAAGLDLDDPTEEPEPAALEDWARAMEGAATAASGIAQAEASASWGRSTLHLAASNGFSGGWSSTMSSLSCTAIGGEGLGMERDYDYDVRTHLGDLRGAEEIGARAAERALARLGPRKPPTGKATVLYDERVAGSLIGHLLQAINGAAIARGASWARGLMGEAVLPEGLDLLEEPHRPRVPGSRRFDAEGLPTADRALVEKGLLQSWLLDLSNARKLGLSSSANASRSARSGPSPSAHNLRLTPGSATREELLADMGTGLWVTSLIGATINPNTGDYSRGASGFWVENGEIAYPVSECTIAGSLPDMLRRIIPANDGREHTGRVIPSLMIERMSIAGA